MQALKQRSAPLGIFTSASLAKDFLPIATLARRSIPALPPPLTALSTEQGEKDPHTAAQAGAILRDGPVPIPGNSNAGVQGGAGIGGGGGGGGMRKELLFADDQLGSFYRRLAWSPDGEPWV